MSKTKRKAKKHPAKDNWQIITADDWQRMKAEAVQEAVLAFSELILAMPMKVMREQYGWGAKKRLPELAELLAQEFETLNSDDMNPAEYVQKAGAICGIKIEAKTGRR